MFDYLIRGGLLVDGSGAAPVRGDLAIQGGKIAALGNLTGAPAKNVIEAGGRFVTPGFIDIHRHADAAVFREGFGRLELKQGLTTIVNGNCGLSVAPCEGAFAAQVRSYLTPVTGAPDAAIPVGTLGAYLDAARAVRLPLSIGMLVGGGSVRAMCAGYETVSLSDAEISAIRHGLESALQDGALGVSLGLGYAPECFYTTEQLIETLQPLKNSGIPVTVHMRQEGSGVVGALEEMLTVARALNTPVEISHLKSIGKENWRKTTPRMLRLMKRARAEGVDIACDVYPYTAGSTQLIHILPPECQTGGIEELSRNLWEPAFRENFRKRMLTGSDFENISLLVGWENIVASSIRPGKNKHLEGKSIAEMAELLQKDPFDTAFDLLAEEHCDVTMIDFVAAEEDICSILRDRNSCVISDSTYPTSGMLHPRVHGTYARLLERYVREQKVLTIQQAVEKVTSRPAARMGLRGKGRLTPGFDADVLIFDLAKIREEGSYQNPSQYASGFDDVFVNGVPAVRNGEFTGEKNGRVIT